MAEVYKSQTTIRFHQADPAGILFFAQVFTLAHDAYEGFIQACGFEFKEWFLENKYLIPIRHTEADYLRPFRAGETYQIEVRVTSFSSSSFQLQYDFFQNQTKHATVKMVHTCMDPQTFQKANIPEIVKKQLQPFYHEPAT